MLLQELSLIHRAQEVWEGVLDSLRNEVLSLPMKEEILVGDFVLLLKIKQLSMLYCGL